MARRRIGERTGCRTGAIRIDRIEQFRHVARETMDVSTSELVILTEMLLRGPQTIGELRGRSSRMHLPAPCELLFFRAC